MHLQRRYVILCVSTPDPKQNKTNVPSSTYLSLLVILRVEIQIVQHHRVGCGQVDAQPTRLRGQQEHCVERRGVKKSVIIIIEGGKYIIESTPQYVMTSPNTYSYTFVIKKTKYKCTHQEW